MSDIKEVSKLTKEFNVLYVEDDDDSREQTATILGLFFNKVLIAKDGKEGLNLFAQNLNDIDLVITDIEMPHLSGIDMLREIKKLNNRCRSLITTAYNEIKYYAEAIEVGVDGFIIKPISETTFVAVMRKIAELLEERRIKNNYRQELERKLQEKIEELDRKLIIDELTGVFNKTKLDADLANRQNCTIAIANLDNFDFINSVYGYETGDAVIRKTARFYESQLGKDAKLYRLASDEFVFVFEHSDIKSVGAFAERLNKELAKQKFIIDDIELNISATIGISVGSAKKALSSAHIAMKEIRKVGKNRSHIYDPNSQIEQKQKENILWLRRLRKALSEDSIVPYFQAIHDNKTGKIEKYECLARIEENGRIITPNYFIEHAKLVGLLPDITKSMLDKSFGFFAPRSEGFSVNITEDDLVDSYLVSHLKMLINKHSINPERVVLELLENISVEGSNDSIAQIKELKGMGFKIALDDFGSEKSNFSRLQELDVDYIKIDGVFIKEITTNQNSYRITKAIKSLANSLEAKVIAEFVHSQEVLDAVKELDIEYSQGYFFSTPIKSPL